MTVQKLLLMKKETTYDTDPTPDGTNAFETIGLSTQRYEGDTVQRDLDRHILGGKQQINVNPHAIANSVFMQPVLAPQVLHRRSAWRSSPVGSMKPLMPV